MGDIQKPKVETLTRILIGGKMQEEILDQVEVKK